MAVAAGEELIMVEEEQQQQEDRKSGGGVRNIVFFDVETTVPRREGQRHELLEFGAVLLDAHGLGELGCFHTLIRPHDPSSINHRTISQHSLAQAPAFTDVAAIIHSLLDGHIWAGHNILEFDIVRVKEAFSEIGREAPQHSGVIDTYRLLKNPFGQRAGNSKLATLANYCGYGKQEHRSLPDVRMNIDVLRNCATKLFLESNCPDIFTAEQSRRSENDHEQSNPDPRTAGHLASQITLASIEAREESAGRSEIKLYYEGFPLQLRECRIKIRFTINRDHALDDKGKPRFSVLVEPSEAACEVIRKCEDLVKSKYFTSASGGEVEWLPALVKEEQTGAPWAARMRIETKVVGLSATYTTKFYHSTSNGVEEISLGHVNVSTFRNIVPHGSVVDVGFGFYVFNVNNRAGVRLLAKHITLT